MTRWIIAAALTATCVLMARPANAQDYEIEAQLFSPFNTGLPGPGINVGFTLGDRVVLLAGLRGSVDQDQFPGLAGQTTEWTLWNASVPLEAKLYLLEPGARTVVPTLRLSLEMGYTYADFEPCPGGFFSAGASGLAGAQYFFDEHFGISVEVGLSGRHLLGDNLKDLPLFSTGTRIASVYRAGLVLRL